MPALSTSFQFALLDSSGDSPSGEFGLPATHYKDLCRATVGDLVSTFRAVHEEYILVVDDDRYREGDNTCVA